MFLVMKIREITFISILLTSIMLMSCSEKTTTDSGMIRLLVGSYGSADKDRIRMYNFDQENGQSKLLCGLKGIADPSFLAITPNGKHIYSVSEKDDSTAALYAIELIQNDITCSMRIINSQLTEGEAPCYVNLYEKSCMALTANYNGSSVSVFSIDKKTGSIRPNIHVEHYGGHGINPERQEKPHIHCVEFTPDSSLLLVNDLGTDRIHVVSLPDSIDAEEPTSFFDTAEKYDLKVEDGSGPRHLTFAPNGRFAYLINELSGMVTVFEYKDRRLSQIQSATCDSIHAQGSADIHISPDGKFLYASNRLKDDGISIFSIDQDNGLVAKIGYQLTGIHPRNFAITPNGKFLLCACRDSNIIQVFKRNADTGMLSETSCDIEMEQPVCVKFIVDSINK